MYQLPVISILIYREIKLATVVGDMTCVDRKKKREKCVYTLAVAKCEITGSAGNWRSMRDTILHI